MSKLHLTRLSRLTRLSPAFLLALSALVLAPAARAENMAYQVVCENGSTERRTPWTDERISKVAFFDRARPGSQYHYCKADCGSFGPGSCNFTPIYEQGHYYPWTERLSAVSCDKVCLHLRAVDGHMNRTVFNTDYTRYSTSYSGFSTLSWWVQSHGGDTPHDWFFEHRNASGLRDGYTLCWDASWNDNYWIAKYGAPGSIGRKTVFTFEDSSGVDHEITVAGYYHLGSHATEEW